MLVYFLNPYHCYLTYTWGSYESMTCVINDIYLTLKSFNDIIPIIPKQIHVHLNRQKISIEHLIGFTRFSIHFVLFVF
jgi:hypothetical protein